MEHDLYGRQSIAWKILKHMNKSEKDTAKLNIISEQLWLEHYRRLWNHENKQTDDRYNYDEDLTSYDGDLITIQELDDALLKTKVEKQQAKME